jgi:hypothetical protein
MDSFNVVEDEILGKLPVKELFIRKKVHIVVHEPPSCVIVLSFGQ